MNFSYRKKFSFYSLFYNSNPFLRYLFTFFILGIITFYWFNNFYNKFESVEAKLENEILILQEKKNNLDNIKNQVKELELNIDFLNKQISEIVNLDKNNIQDNLDIIIKSADDSKMLVTFCNNKEIADKPFYKKDLVSFNLTGNFYQLLEFLKQISSLKKLKLCKRFNISRINENELLIECLYKFYSKNLEAKCSENYFAS